ncbi:IclR family transcriptional regulator [Paenibacillus alkaliterrae]|uniref:IclR family transcriptional regulator n=1 Tax=Paenibacillus alkaliterrae TaxID=320909 RepID=UPI001F19A41C|nr:IclR family transcriptional regulator [Paenibacillus alkaliterrae]MCF2940055.1 IclR family transcriptional regulator [Paenibacillus alkaliterrae]
MERKYWVPAIDRANAVLTKIASNPSSLKLMELSAQTGINKSTMFSLLQTLEALEWVKRDQGDTYSLGAAFAFFGNAYFASFDLVKQFLSLAAEYVERIGETLQIARLERGEIIYLAKKEAPSPVRLLSEPGMRMPAYATAMGKMLLSALSDNDIADLYGNAPFQAYTANTLSTVEALTDHLKTVRASGFAVDSEEIVPGFVCVAAPIYDRAGNIIAATSFSMPAHHWEEKREAAIAEIGNFARRLSTSL